MRKAAEETLYHGDHLRRLGLFLQFPDRENKGIPAGFDTPTGIFEAPPFRWGFFSEVLIFRHESERSA